MGGGTGGGEVQASDNREDVGGYEETDGSNEEKYEVLQEKLHINLQYQP